MANHHVLILVAAILLLSTFASDATVLANTTVAPATKTSSNTTFASTTIALANTTVASTATALANSGKPTPYDMLKQYGFPPGVLPTGATGYVLRSDGSFEAYLPAECSFHIDKWSVRFSTRIAGNIQTGSIHDLEGVKLKVVLVWVGIKQVDRDGDQLRFHAGAVSQSFSVGNFASSPQCS
ncbi:hypothetical protein ACP70R_001578 [Stipagrostis hirtigluma subsp. patula]